MRPSRQQDCSRELRLALDMALTKAVVLAALATSAHAALLLSVFPLRGSNMGGTKLTLLGSGFNRGGVQVRGAAVCINGHTGGNSLRHVSRCWPWVPVFTD